jgi:nucleoside-diphosphate-sugar epimerase
MTNSSGKNVLVVGATGFLGPALVEELSLAGFQVICGVRNFTKAARQLNFPNVKLLRVELNTDIHPEVWLARLQEHSIDYVVNNVGIANPFGGQSLENVNVLAPLALFKAMESYHSMQKRSSKESASPRIIQISTTGVDWPDCYKFPYPESKRILEEHLTRLGNLVYLIIRPNVIYEPERGHLLLEQIARMPLIFYIGHALIQPVHCREIAIGVARLLKKDKPIQRSILRATGPTPMSWKEIFATSSAALGKKHVYYCSIPLKLAQFVTMMIQKLPKRLLYRFGVLSKMDPDTIVMMTKGSTGSNEDWLKATGLRAIGLDETYREYGKGAESYAAFIEGIRNSSASLASQQDE